MKVLGIKCNGHDTGAACLSDDLGKLSVSAISEARLNRRKHSYAYPLLSIDYVLKEMGIKSLDELDLICIDGHGIPWPESGSQFGRYAARHGLDGKGDFDPRFSYLVEQSIKFPVKKVVYLSHIDAHAASAYYVSGWDDAAVLTIEGGMGLYQAKGNDLSVVCRTGYGDDEYQDRRLTIDAKLSRPPNRMNISNLYDAVTKKLGLDQFAAGKTMALAAFRDGFPKVDYIGIPKNRHNGFMTDYSELVRKIDREVKAFVPTSQENRDEELVQEYWVNIAREAQDALEEDVLLFAKMAHEMTGSRNLCLAGGVALSCVTNRKILDLGLFDNVFVQPAASDEGIPLGCALFGYHKLLGGKLRHNLQHAYLGRQYDPGVVPAILNEWCMSYEKVEAADVAKVLADGKIIGRCFGRSEYGPRALGNRSILADPRIPNMLEIVNTQVKHRERYRPFAPSSHEEKQHLYFDLPVPSPFMLMACKVMPGVEKVIPAVIHVDATSRVQTVRKDQNAGYYSLIQEFGNMTGVFVLLNTSFNDDGEPIVEDYRDALLSFLRTGLDYLYIEGFLVSRPDAQRCVEIRRQLGNEIKMRVDQDYQSAVKKYCDLSKYSLLNGTIDRIVLRDVILSWRDLVKRASRLEVRADVGGVSGALRRLLNRVSSRARFGIINWQMRSAQLCMVGVYAISRIIGLK